MARAAITEDHFMPHDSTARTCLTLRSSQLGALRDLSRQSGAPVAELIRRAADAYLSDRIAGYVACPGQQTSRLDQPDLAPNPPC